MRLDRPPTLLILSRMMADVPARISVFCLQTHDDTRFPVARFKAFYSGAPIKIQPGIASGPLC